MELTNLQLMILLVFEKAMIQKEEAAALLTLLNEKEITSIIDKVIEMDRMPTTRS